MADPTTDQTQPPPNREQTEAMRVSDRKIKVCKAIQDKFSEEIWQEKLMRISRGDAGRVAKGLNSFMVLLTNDGGSGKPTKKYICEAKISSLCNCFLEAFQLGLEIGGGKDLCAIVVYDGNAELEITYKGFVNALKRHYEDAYVKPGLVFVGDHFSVIQSGENDTFELKPKPENISKRQWEKLEIAFCYFAYALPVSKQRVSRIVTVDKAMLSTIRSKARQDYVWKDFWDEMSLKAAIRRASKIPFAMIDFDEEITLEEVDNRQYNLETSGNRLARLMDAHKEMLDEESKPRADSPAPEAPAKVAPAAQAVSEPTPAEEAASMGDPAPPAVQEPTQAASVSDATYEEITPEAETVAAATAEAVQQQKAKAPSTLPWDGQSIYTAPEKATVKDFEDAKAAYLYLLPCIKSRKSKASRLMLIELNSALVGELIRTGNGDCVNELHKLASQGE